MKKKPVAVWLSRDSLGDADDCVAVSMTKPKSANNDGFVTFLAKHYFLAVFCVKDFETVTGFIVPPGTCVKVRIKIEEVA